MGVCWSRLRSSKATKAKVSDENATSCSKLSELPQVLIMENIDKESFKCLVDFKDEDDQKHYQELDDYMHAQMDYISLLIAKIIDVSRTSNQVETNLKMVEDIVIPPLKTRFILTIDELLDIFYLAMSKLYTGTLSRAMFQNYRVDIAGKTTYLSDLASIRVTEQTVKITLYKDPNTNMMIMEALKKKISSSSGLEPMICDDSSMVVHAPACMSRDYIQCAVYHVESHLKRLEERIRKVGKEACDRLKEAAKDRLLGLDEKDLMSNFQITELLERSIEIIKKSGKEVIGRLTKSL